MNKSQLLLFFITCCLVTSCATHSGTVTNSHTPHSSKGRIYQDKVYGYSSCHYVFGIGGMGSQGLAAEAIFNLKCGVKLDTGEYLDNFTIDHRRFYFVPFYVHHEVLVTADKIKDLDENDVLYSNEYALQNENFNDIKNNYFRLNEKVFIQNPNGAQVAIEAVIIKHLRNGAKVITFNNKGKIKRKRPNYRYIFKKEARGNTSFFLTAKKGDTVRFNNIVFGEHFFRKAIFLGSNNAKILLKGLNSSKTYISNLRTIILEDSTQVMREKLNQKLILILENTKAEQKIIGKTDSNELIKGNLQGVVGNDVSIKLDNSNKEIMLDISNVYTLENWLEFSDKKYDKLGFHVGDKVSYYKDDLGKGLLSEILGFRYHNVLIRTTSGEMLEVPIGKLM